MGEPTLGSQIPRKSWAALCKAGFLLLVLPVLFLESHGANATVPLAGPLQEAAAYSTFETLVTRSKPQNDMPRLSNPSDAAVLDRLWDEKSVLGQGPYTYPDSKALQSILVLETRVLGQYIAAAKADGTAATHGDSAYQAEIARADAFVLETSPAFLESASDVVARSMDLKHLTAQQGQQLKQLAGAIDLMANQVEGAIGVIGQGHYSAANQKVIADALARSAPRLAVQFTPAQRARLVQATVKALATADPAAAPELGSLVATLSGRGCSTFCEIGQIAASGNGPSGPTPPAAQPVLSRAAIPAPQKPQASIAAPGGLLVPHPEVGAKYGSEPTYSCSSTAAPKQGPITQELATQYVICKLDTLATGGGYLNLVQNVHVEVGRALSTRQPVAYDADLKSPAYPIRGSLDSYMCQPLAGADGVVLSPRNCSIKHERNAKGVCYRVGGFDDWNCVLGDSTAQSAGDQPPPGPLSAAQVADIRQHAPVAMLVKGMHFFQQGDYANASQAFKSILKDNPVDPLASLWNQIVQIQSGDIWADMFISNVGDTYPVVDELLALSAWRKGKSENAKGYLKKCMHRADKPSSALCTDMEHGVESGASAPDVKQWPAIVGLDKATNALAAGSIRNN